MVQSLFETDLHRGVVKMFFEGIMKIRDDFSVHCIVVGGVTSIFLIDFKKHVFQDDFICHGVNRYPGSAKDGVLSNGHIFNRVLSIKIRSYIEIVTDVG